MHSAAGSYINESKRPSQQVFSGYAGRKVRVVKQIIYHSG